LRISITNDYIDSNSENEDIQSNWDPNYKTHYINSDSLDETLWRGRVKLDILKLKDGKTHEFILNQITKEGTIFSRSITTNRDRLIYSNQIETILYNNKFYHSLAEFTSDFNIKNDYKRIIVNFDYINKDDIKSNRYIELQKIYEKFNQIYLMGLDSNRGEQRTFKLSRMNNIKINGINVEDNLSTILSIVNN